MYVNMVFEPLFCTSRSAGIAFRLRIAGTQVRVCRCSQLTMKLPFVLAPASKAAYLPARKSHSCVDTRESRKAAIPSERSRQTPRRRRACTAAQAAATAMPARAAAARPTWRQARGRSGEGSARATRAASLRPLHTGTLARTPLHYTKNI